MLVCYPLLAQKKSLVVLKCPPTPNLLKGHFLVNIPEGVFPLFDTKGARLRGTQVHNQPNSKILIRREKKSVNVLQNYSLILGVGGLKTFISLKGYFK